jgi:hypothetical protein
MLSHMTIKRRCDFLLRLSFGGSFTLTEINSEQIRRFADTAKLPLKPLVMETIERTIEAWKTLEEKDLLPLGIRDAIDKQIHAVAINTHRLFP